MIKVMEKTTTETLILIAIKLMGKKQPNIQNVSVCKNKRAIGMA